MKRRIINNAFSIPVVTTLIKGQTPNRRQQLQPKYKPSEIHMKILHFQRGVRKKLPTYVALIVRVNVNAKTSPLRWESSHVRFLVL